MTDEGEGAGDDPDGRTGADAPDRAADPDDLATDDTPADPAESASDADDESAEEGPTDRQASQPDPSAAEPDPTEQSTETPETRTVETTAGDAPAEQSDDPPNEPTTTQQETPVSTPETESEPGPAPEADPTQQDSSPHKPGVPEDVRKYDRFQKIDGSTYDRANEFLRDRTYITAREWAIARLCADFRTETGVEMTKIGENLPELVPFMTDTYTPQAVNQARAAFEDKVRKSGATFLYGAMSDFFTAEELDDVMYEATEVAKFLLEVEGVDLTVEQELEAEDTISEVMREVREHSAALRHDEVVCPECGEHIEAEGD